jgi:transketolase
LFAGTEKPDIVLVGTGSEASICVEGAKILSTEGVKVRVVSLPSFEVFGEQPVVYQKSVFPDTVPVLSVEAMSTFGWERYAHYSIGINSFGASGPYKVFVLLIRFLFLGCL